MTWRGGNLTMTIPPHHHIDARTVGRAGITATTPDLTAVRLVGGWITRRMFHYPVSVLSVSARHYRMRAIIR